MNPHGDRTPGCWEQDSQALGTGFPSVGNRIPGCWEQPSRYSGAFVQCSLLFLVRVLSVLLSNLADLDMFCIKSRLCKGAVCLLVQAAVVQCDFSSVSSLPPCEAPSLTEAAERQRALPAFIVSVCWRERFGTGLYKPSERLERGLRAAVIIRFVPFYFAVHALCRTFAVQSRST